MEIALNISDRARKYGYIFWKRENDFDIYELLGKREKIDIILDGKNLGTKKIDRKNRRISITMNITRRFPPDKENMILTIDNKNRLNVTLR